MSLWEAEWVKSTLKYFTLTWTVSIRVGEPQRGWMSPKYFKVLYSDLDSFQFDSVSLREPEWVQSTLKYFTLTWTVFIRVGEPQRGWMSPKYFKVLYSDLGQFPFESVSLREAEWVKSPLKYFTLTWTVFVRVGEPLRGRMSQKYFKVLYSDLDSFHSSRWASERQNESKVL